MDTLKFNINPKEWLVLIIITFILAWCFFGCNDPQTKPICEQVKMTDIGTWCYELEYKGCHYFQYTGEAPTHMINCPNTHIADTVVIKQLIEFE